MAITHAVERQFTLMRLRQGPWHHHQHQVVAGPVSFHFATGVVTVSKRPGPRTWLMRFAKLIRLLRAADFIRHLWQDHLEPFLPFLLRGRQRKPASA